MLAGYFQSKPATLFFDFLSYKCTDTEKKKKNLDFQRRDPVNLWESLFVTLAQTTRIVKVTSVFGVLFDVEWKEHSPETLWLSISLCGMFVAAFSWSEAVQTLNNCIVVLVFAFNISSWSPHTITKRQYRLFKLTQRLLDCLSGNQLLWSLIAIKISWRTKTTFQLSVKTLSLSLCS